MRDAGRGHRGRSQHDQCQVAGDEGWRRLSAPVGGRLGRNCLAQRHDGDGYLLIIEFAVQSLPIGAPGALGQPVSTTGQHEGAQQQRLHAESEDRVTRFTKQDDSPPARGN